MQLGKYQTSAAIMFIKRGVKFMPTQPDVNTIMKKLKENSK